MFKVLRRIYKCYKDHPDVDENKIKDGSTDQSNSSINDTLNKTKRLWNTCRTLYKAYQKKYGLRL